MDTRHLDVLEFLPSFYGFPLQRVGDELDRVNVNTVITYSTSTDTVEVAEVADAGEELDDLQ